MSCTRNPLYAGPNANLGGEVWLINVSTYVLSLRSCAITCCEPYQVRKEAVLSGISDVPQGSFKGAYCSYVVNQIAYKVGCMAFLFKKKYS